MGYVTIEGSSTMPTDVLARGARRTVAVTDSIRKLVKIGGAIVVSGSLDDPDAPAYGAPPADHTGTSEDDPSGDTSLPTEDFAPAEDAPVPAAETDTVEPTAKRGRSTRAKESAAAESSSGGS